MEGPDGSNNIKAKFRQFLSENFVLPNGLDDDDSFLDTGVIDSTGVLELEMFIEETFGFEVADEELIPENLDSVNKVTAYVSRKLNDVTQ